MEEPTPAGYTHLFWKYRAAPELLRQQVFIRDDSRPKETRPVDSHLEVTYPRRFKPGESDYEHLVFALKNEGVQLELYRFPDLTVQAEATFGWLQRAVEEDLPRELAFLQKFDEAIAKMREVVEMPDRLERLFARLAMQNQGRIANKKRRHFSDLDDETTAALEAAVTMVLNGAETVLD